MAVDYIIILAMQSHNINNVNKMTFSLQLRFWFSIMLIICYSVKPFVKAKGDMRIGEINGLDKKEASGFLKL